MSHFKGVISTLLLTSTLKNWGKNNRSYKILISTLKLIKFISLVKQNEVKLMSVHNFKNE